MVVVPDSDKSSVYSVIIIIKYPQCTFLDFFYFAIILFAAEVPDDRAICEIAQRKTEY